MDFLLVDNSKDPEAHKLITELNPELEVIYSPFGGTTRKSQCDAYNVIRARVLDEGYDYLMIIESDLFPQEGIIEDLMANDKDIVGAPYLIYGQGNDCDATPCVTSGKFAPSPSGFRETFMEWSELDGTLKQTMGGCGLGCCLIKREVLETITSFKWAKSHADTYFHRDAHRLGFETWIDTRFMVDHHPSEYPEYF